MNETIGKRIKKLRKSKGLSQEEVADYLHISQSAYSRIERGESASWTQHIQSIGSLFKIKPKELTRQEVNTTNQNRTQENNNGVVINPLSENLIEQYELRIKQKDIYINELECLLESLKAGIS